ncbi:MAG: Coenzyme synthesis protein [Actinomycetota bacterium]
MIRPGDPPEARTIVDVSPYVVVLGIAQDGGRPQAGCRRSCCRGQPSASPACLAIVDPAAGVRWIVDATPAIGEQLAHLDQVAPSAGAAVDGVLLTHAHMGHYTGLVHLGREAYAADAVPVVARPSMVRFLTSNSPWRELADHGHVDFVQIDEVFQMTPSVRVTAVPVPHRDELSDTVGFVVDGPDRRVLWLPDIDGWDEWDRDLIDVLSSVDVAYLDGTFFDDDELDRDMSLIPHPRVMDTLRRVTVAAPHLAGRVRFVHLNHTNPALDTGTRERAVVESAGMAVAVEGERFDL